MTTKPLDGGDREVTVCDRCLMACCWQGLLMCDCAKGAGTRLMTVAQLTELGREHPSYWEPSHD